MTTKAFWAYPGGRPLVSEAITQAVEVLSKKIQPTTWEQMGVIGLKIDDRVREEVLRADVVIADITYENFNVYYEIGFAIASERPVIPTVNVAVADASKNIARLGLFDTIGWIGYENGFQLKDRIEDWKNQSWINRYVKPKNHSQPLFLLDTQAKTDFRNHIVSTIENSQVEHRAFDPTQTSRLTAAKAISEVSSSAGLVLPLLSNEIADSNTNNLRAAFMLGLAHGYEIEALAIQFDHGPAPLDYRDYITNSTFRGETVRHVQEYCEATLVRNQSVSLRSSRDDLGIIGQLDLGSPVAEYETQQLEFYFVKTAEYSRALRAEGAVVAGRKGSGKSALYLKIVDDLQREKRRSICDLRPATHNLSEMREELLSIIKQGVFDHTIAAFWQYVMLMEVLLKLREDLLPRSKNDFDLQERIRSIEERFGLDETMVAGDFTSRLATAIDTVVESLKTTGSEVDVRENITNQLFERLIPQLREAISDFSDYFDEIVLLIDDLDKGWPPLRVESHDVSTIKHLIEVLHKIRRDLGRAGISFRHLVFLRSDIYEKLVEQTPDRGKYNVINVDWTDREQLEFLLKQRVWSSVDKKLRPEAWECVNADLPDGAKAIDFAIDCSLMRPRFLIDFVERCLSSAINRGHGFVDEEDVLEGARQMSLFLVSDFAYEMRDVAGTPEDIFYVFIGAPEFLSHSEVCQLLRQLDMDMDENRVIELLLWYGFLGAGDIRNQPIFIYDRSYDFRRLLAERGQVTDSTMYAINPAFLRGLD
jgi:hypothetical protein